jgi:hypothetical protein
LIKKGYQVVRDGLAEARRSTKRYEQSNLKKIILTLTLLVGFYALLRNNVGKLPDEIVWITNPEIFYKVFIPLLLIVSAAFALFQPSKKNIFFLSMIVVFIDAINRLSIIMNKFYGYVVYDIGPFFEESYVGNELAKVRNIWPIYVLLGIEILMLILFFKSFTSFVIETESSSSPSSISDSAPRL